MEKWSIIFFEFALTSELLITIFYWGFLFTGFKDEDTSFKKFIDFFGHAMPAGLLLIDFSFNIIPIHYRHIPLCLIALLIYAIVNIIVTLTDKPVYSLLTWNDGMSWVYIGGLAILEIGLFYLVYFIAKFKNRKYILRSYK